MSDLNKIKNDIAIEKGYPDWETMENWVIDHNSPVNVAVVLVGAMDEVCEKLIVSKRKVEHFYKQRLQTMNKK